MPQTDLPDGVELTELDCGLRVVTEAVPVGALGGARALGADRIARRDARPGRRLALPRAPAVQGHRAALGDRDLRGLGRDGRGDQRGDEQGVDAPLRPPARRAHRGRVRAACARCCSHPTCPGRDRLRAPGRARGDRDVRGRALRPRPRRPRRGDLRRPPARPPRPRARRGDRLDPGSRHRRLSRRPLHGGERRRRGRRQPRARRRSSSSPQRGSPPRRAATAPRRQRRPSPSRTAACSSTRRRPSSTTSASAARGIARDDERRFALGILDSIFGGSVSSRLFREVREKRGLAYSVGSYTEQFADQGTVAMYVGTREDNVARGLRDHRPRAGEASRRRRHRGRARAGQGARQGPHGPRARGDRGADVADRARGSSSACRSDSLDEMLARIDAVTPRRGRRAGATISTRPESLAAACVGPDESRFRDAAGHVSDALVA